MPRILIAKYSPLSRDPRVLRQMEVLSSDFEIVTAGFGRRPPLSTEHFELPQAEMLPPARKALAGLTMAALPAGRRYDIWSQGLLHTSEFKSLLTSVDVVLVNDVLAVPIGVASGKPFHVDLHEYSLDQGKSLRWRIVGMPMVRWTAGLLGLAGSASTVAPGIAARYQREYGINPFVVTNAPPYQPDFTPTPTKHPIKLVHMGAAGRPRSLEMPVKAVINANKENPGSITLDYYLVPGDKTYIEELRHLAGNPHTTGVTLKTPVTFEEIIPTLRQYDAAIAFFPPTTTNLKHALPNKFFEAVQARIGVITGPSQEMTPYLNQYGIGTTTQDWTQQSLNHTIANLTPETINTWKQATHQAAPQLGSEQQDQKWHQAITNLTKQNNT